MPTFALYDTLGVTRRASRDDIAKAFRRRSLEQMQGNGGRLASLAKAYRILSDPKLRARYDELGDALLDTIDLVGPDPAPPTASEIARMDEVLRAATRASTPRRAPSLNLSRKIGLVFAPLGVLGLVGYWAALRAEVQDHAAVIHVQIQWVVLCDVLVAFGVLLAVTGISLHSNLGALSLARRAGLALFSAATLTAIGISSYALFHSLERAGYGDHLPPAPAPTYPPIQPQPLPMPTFTAAPAKS